MNEQKQIFRRWFKKLISEEEQPAKSYLKRYEARFVIMITKRQGLQKTEAVQQIRGIPGVTTVYKESEIDVGERQYKGLYNIKFFLEHASDLDYYLNKVLKRRINSIDGCHVISFKGVEELSQQ